MSTYARETEGTEWAKASDGTMVTLPYKPMRSGGYWFVSFYDEVVVADSEMTGDMACAMADSLNEAYMRGFEACVNGMEINGNG